MSRVNTKFTNKIMGVAGAALVYAAMLMGAGAAVAQSVDNSVDQAVPGSPEDLSRRATYVDLVDLAERSDLVIRARIRRQTQVEAERAPGLEPGFARLYIEADTLALIAGNTPLRESLVYLVDVPLDAKGKPPKLKKREVILFAKPAGAGAKGATRLQLTDKAGQLAYSPDFENRLRAIITSLVTGDQPPLITGVRDALAVPGTLVGESETQIFLTTQDRSPVSMTVLRRPGQPPAWGVSWGEIIDSSARAPQPETLRWYRLACSLPNRLPSAANLARDPAARRLAASDYAFIVESLGDCARAITNPPL